MLSDRRVSPSYLSYYPIWATAQLFGLASVILIGLIYNKRIGPTGYDWSQHPFNFHPLMMTIGLLFCYGNAILSYRTLNTIPKLTVKLLHASLLALSLIFGLVGLVAVIRSKNAGKAPHFMSLHAWIGLTTLILFFLQWICGFVTFLVPKLGLDARLRYMPSHRFWGRTIFLFAVGTIIMGISELFGFYDLFPGKESVRLMLIFFGLFAVGFAVIVSYLVGSTRFQRPADEDTVN